MDKVKITQKDFDEIYQIQDSEEITEEKDTVLNEEEQKHDDKMQRDWEEA